MPVVDYFQNYDYIVNVLCENKEKPMLECNGKCYLSKLLAEEADDESNPFSEKLSKYEIPLLLHESESLGIEFELKEKSSFEHFVMNGGILYFLDLTRPPRKLALSKTTEAVRCYCQKVQFLLKHNIPNTWLGFLCPG